MPEFKSIFQILKSEKAFNKMNELVEDYRVVDEFGKVFPDLQKVVTPVKIKNSILYLRAENSVWKSELNFRQKLIVDKINNHFGQTLVKSVKFIS